MDTSSGIPAHLTIWAGDSGHKMHVRFIDSDTECIIPISPGQYQVLLDSINKNFLGSFADAPDDAELGILSGIRFMAPMDSMNAIYSSPDRANRIIMINIDAQKEVMTFYRVSSKPDKKVVSFDAPIDWMKNFGKKVDFGATEILNDGQMIRFGEFEISSIDLIKWVDHK